MDLGREITIVVIGDGYVGKTCMLHTYAEGTYPSNSYKPTIFEERQVDVKVRGEICRLFLKDTAGQEEFHALRKLAFPGTNVFLVCYDISAPQSFKNVDHWTDEVRKVVPHAQFVLVGTKQDQRGQAKQCVTVDEAKALAKRLRIRRAVECSSQDSPESVKRVFDCAIQLHYDSDGRKQGPCALQ